jgi:hypothetical protein
MILAKICFTGNRIYYTGYRPMIKIRDDEMFNSCELMFKNRKSVAAGEEIETYIIFLDIKFVIDYLYVGRRFLAHEGYNVVAQGEIIEVSCPDIGLQNDE